MWNGEWKAYVFGWPVAFVAAGVSATLVALWLSARAGPNELQLSGTVAIWPLELRPNPPIKITRSDTSVCLLLPADFQTGVSQGLPPVRAPDGQPVAARVEVCLDDGRCIGWDSWRLILQTNRRFYCPSGTQDLEVGRRVASVRIEASPAMRAESVWLLSYDRK